MTVATARRTGAVTLRAPTEGIVRLQAPRDPCGELEVFDRGDLVARVGDVEVCAPVRGFVLRVLAPEGSVVDQGAPLVLLSRA